VLIAAVASTYVARHFAIDTDTAKLIAADAPWRQSELAFDAAFPHRGDLIAIVVDGATPELAERATAELTQRIAGTRGDELPAHPLGLRVLALAIELPCHLDGLVGGHADAPVLGARDRLLEAGGIQHRALLCGGFAAHRGFASHLSGTEGRGCSLPLPSR